MTAQAALGMHSCLMTSLSGLLDVAPAWRTSPVMRRSGFMYVAWTFAVADVGKLGQMPAL